MVCDITGIAYYTVIRYEVVNKMQRMVKVHGIKRSIKVHSIKRKVKVHGIKMMVKVHGINKGSVKKTMHMNSSYIML
jgi:hypothetical protein